jgi:hypothetical protein
MLLHTMTDSRLDEITDRLNTLTTKNEEMMKMLIDLKIRLDELDKDSSLDVKEEMHKHSLDDNDDDNTVKDYLRGLSRPWERM